MGQRPHVSSAGGLSQTTSNLFDTAGRTIASFDVAHLATTYQYPDLLTSVTITPGGLLTNTTIRYADGQTKCTIQNGVIQSWNDSGVNPDGTRWSIAYTGPAGSNSPMWQKTTTDLLGRTIRTERPGFASFAPFVVTTVLCACAGKMMFSWFARAPRTQRRMRCLAGAPGRLIPSNRCGSNLRSRRGHNSRQILCALLSLGDLCVRIWMCLAPDSRSFRAIPPNCESCARGTADCPI